MKIKQLYTKDEEININTYLEKLGVSDVDLYLKPNKKVLEKPSSYLNMDKAVEIIKEYISE